MPAKAWAVAKSLDLIKPAGQVFPTKHAVFSNSADAEDVTVAQERWTDSQLKVVEAFRVLAHRQLGFSISVSIINSSQYMGACYGDQSLCLNVRRLGKSWFEPDNGQLLGERHLSLLLHELAHEFSSDHLSAEYHKAICDLGAKLALLVRADSQVIVPKWGVATV